MNLVRIRFRFNVKVITNTNLKEILREGSRDEVHDALCYYGCSSIGFLLYCMIMVLLYIGMITEIRGGKIFNGKCYTKKDPHLVMEARRIILKEEPDNKESLYAPKT